MAQSNRLKSFIRVDASGRDVPSTNVLRYKKPVTGRWRELEAYECCGASVFLSSTPADVSLATVTFTLNCDVTAVGTNVITPTAATVTIQDVVATLNDAIPFYGLFSVAANDTDIELRLKEDIANALCSSVATLSFTIA